MGMSRLRASEFVLAIYFVYTAVLAAERGMPGVALLSTAVPLILCGMAAGASGVASSIVRDWFPVPFILLAYWAVGWFAAPGYLEFASYWIRFDRVLFDKFRFQALIESGGSVLPALLELSYLLLYAAPPLLIGVLYLYRRRDRVDRFLFTLLMGTLVTYALLPHFPSASPRNVYPGVYEPQMTNIFRRANLWLLSNCDIRTSVFPSGHVTVAFSAAFGMMQALPEKKWLGRSLSLFAILVTLNTVYARYHYAVDALAGFAISLLGFAASQFRPRYRRSQIPDGTGESIRGPIIRIQL
jgi:membrane-associated phospholipid phosphatase